MFENINRKKYFFPILVCLMTMRLLFLGCLTMSPQSKIRVYNTELAQEEQCLIYVDGSYWFTKSIFMGPNFAGAFDGKEVSWGASEKEWNGGLK